MPRIPNYNFKEDMGDHFHSASKVYPTLAAGVAIIAGAGAWELGNFTEIVPINTITDAFDIHWVTISASSVTDTYELVLYYGASNIECARVRLVEPVGVPTMPSVPIMSCLIPANSAINAKLASASGGADTLTISIGYHTY